MAKIGIYKITNPNGRIYIGQSTNIEGRWNVINGFKKTCGKFIWKYKTL